MHRRASLIIVLLAIAHTGVAPPAVAAPVLTPPVDAVVERRFDGPDKMWGPGHRGIDYAVAPGTWVRAAAAGTVSFAGRVPDGYAVTLDHGIELETTYSLLDELTVSEGDIVGEGAWIGRAGRSHPTASGGLHFGVKAAGRYVDPMLHLGPLDASAAIRLVPLEEAPDEVRCNESAPLPDTALPPPNDNVVVLIGGITSSTDSPPEIFGTGDSFGYPEGRVFRFSYRGPDGPDLHEPYEASDTFGDLRDVAERLRRLLERIATRYPGTDVDLIAHSQGGVVARTYLAEQARVWDERLPRVEHLVTFASPHQGVPAVGEIDDLRDGPVVSRLLVSGFDTWAERGAPIPPTDAKSLSQMEPGSPLLASLARQDVSFGTKVLALSIPNDLIVPQRRAEYPGKDNVVVPSEGWFGHSAITRSPRALQVARAFLSGAGAACPPDLGLIDRHLGRIVDRGQALLGELVNSLARRVLPV